MDKIKPDLNTGWLFYNAAQNKKENDTRGMRLVLLMGDENHTQLNDDMHNSLSITYFSVCLKVDYFLNTSIKATAPKLVQKGIAERSTLKSLLWLK
jgi:hypothetical protein